MKYKGFTHLPRSVTMQFFVVLLFTLLEFAVSEVVDYRVELALTACTPRDCLTAGPLCETCSNLVGCVDQGNGIYNKTHLATCSAPQYCVDGACTSDYDPFCSGVADLAFNCTTVGIFPDPFYQNRYVLCVQEGTSLKPYLNECQPPGYGFNVADDLCSVQLQDTTGCPGKEHPVPLCDHAGQTGAIPAKPALYFICEERSYGTNKVALYPVLYLCEKGLPYVNYRCGGTETTTTEITSTDTNAPSSLGPLST